MSEDLGSSGARDVLRRLGTSVIPALQGTQVLAPHGMAAIGARTRLASRSGCSTGMWLFPRCSWCLLMGIRCSLAST